MLSIDIKSCSGFSKHLHDYYFSDMVLKKAVWKSINSFSNNLIKSIV